MTHSLVKTFSGTPCIFLAINSFYTPFAILEAILILFLSYLVESWSQIHKSIHFLKENDTRNTSILTDCCNNQEFLRKSQKKDFDLLPRETWAEYSRIVDVFISTTYIQTSRIYHWRKIITNWNFEHELFKWISIGWCHRKRVLSSPRNLWILF